MGNSSAVRKNSVERPFDTAKRPPSTYGEYGEPANNFFQTPICYIAAVARKVFQGGAEKEIVNLVMMEEWGGFGRKKRKGAPISIPEFSERLGFDDKSISNGVARLLKIGILEKVGKERSNIGCYHVNLAKMEAAAPYVYEPQPKLEKVPKSESSEPREWYIIAPGKVVMIPFYAPLPGTDEWVESIVGVLNDAPISLAVAATRAEKAPQLRISESAKLQLERRPDATGEQKAKTSGKHPPTPAFQFVEQKAKTGDSKQLSDFQFPVAKLLRNHYDEEVNSAIVRLVHDACLGVPVDYFFAFADAKLRDRFAHWRAERSPIEKKPKTGWLGTLAKGALAKWSHEARQRLTDEADQTARLATLAARLSPAEDGDPPVETKRCGKCGGEITRFRSGLISACACAAKAKSGARHA